MPLHPVRVADHAAADLAAPTPHVQRWVDSRSGAAVQRTEQRIARRALPQDAAQVPWQRAAAAPATERATVPVFLDPPERDVDPLLAQGLTRVHPRHHVHAMSLHAALHGHHVSVLNVHLHDRLLLHRRMLVRRRLLQGDPEFPRGTKRQAHDRAVAVLAPKERLVVRMPPDAVPTITVKVDVRAVRPLVFSETWKQRSEYFGHDFLHERVELP
mmetsp:Transcript_24574/g.68406  ORF Transcript_24574/g.68406 Transcript_24574/m.68406 type:complete len:214 (+) Transcript_24574:467-1108(+)